jgi:glucans biosynthesis protein
MNRRSFVEGVSAAIALALSLERSGSAFAQESPTPDQPAPFSHEWLLQEASRLAGQPYQAPSTDLPDGLGDLDYHEYLDIRYKPEARIWANEPTRFQLDLFHRGFIFKDRVKISIVDGGAVTTIPFSTSLFDYGSLVKPPAQNEDMDFSGFRARNPINSPDVWDEFVVFQGASYFRAVGRGQNYGLSARGLTINTAEPEGEEFPAFRQFWIERPAPDAQTLIVHALLDSPSTTGAYRFAITPGAETTIDVDAAIFPRQEIKKVGIASLTSMFMFNATNRAGFDDFRRAVHDSDGLQMLTGAGEWVWRPLANPRELQTSLFKDKQPRGFGLMQRARLLSDFDDLEAAYERRPSLWIEPLGDWGEGFVELVEIPTDSEVNDNIVAFWRPNGPVPAGGPWRFAYRMRWTDEMRPPATLLVTAASHAGLSFDRQRRLFVVDFGKAGDGHEGPQVESLKIDVSASKGNIVNPVIHTRQPGGVIRVSFELDTGSEGLSELRLRLMAGDTPASETWLYRWTAR